MKKLPKNAQEVMVKRYALRDETGSPTETVEDILARSARVVSQAARRVAPAVRRSRWRQRRTVAPSRGGDRAALGALSARFPQAQP